MKIREPAGHWVGNTFKLESPVALPGGEDVTVVLRLPEVGAARLKAALGVGPGTAVSYGFRSIGRWPLAEVTPSPASVTLVKPRPERETENQSEARQDDGE